MADERLSGQWDTHIHHVTECVRMTAKAKERALAAAAAKAAVDSRMGTGDSAGQQAGLSLSGFSRQTLWSRGLGLLRRLWYGEESTAAEESLEGIVPAEEIAMTAAAEGSGKGKNAAVPLREPEFLRDGGVFMMPFREKKESGEERESAPRRLIRKITGLAGTRKLYNPGNRAAGAGVGTGLTDRRDKAEKTIPAAPITRLKPEKLSPARPVMELHRERPDNYLLDSYDRSGSYSKLGPSAASRHNIHD